MENPAQEIAHVVRSLTMGSPEQQQTALTTYCLPDASLAHPLLRIPSFPRGALPLLPCIDSRKLLLAALRLSRTLSPRARVSVEAAAFDDRKGLLYVSARRVFSLWFLPLHAADVRLVMVLRLVRRESSEVLGSDGSAGAKPLDKKGKQKMERESRSGEGSKLGLKEGQGQQQEEEGKQLKYYVASQQDLYQPTDLLKLVAPPPLPLLLCLLQLLGAVLCVVVSVLLRPLYHFMNDVSDRESGIEL